VATGLLPKQQPFHNSQQKPSRPCRVQRSVPTAPITPKKTNGKTVRRLEEEPIAQRCAGKEKKPPVTKRTLCTFFVGGKKSLPFNRAEATAPSLFGWLKKANPRIGEYKRETPQGLAILWRLRIASKLHQ